MKFSKFNTANRIKNTTDTTFKFHNSFKDFVKDTSMSIHDLGDVCLWNECSVSDEVRSDVA